MRARLLGRGAARLALVLLAAAPLRAGGEPRTTRVEVHVVARVGEEIHLDVGRAQGLEIGDRVRLEIPGAAPREALVVAASANWSRARLEGLGALVEAGARGSVLVPAERLETKPQGAVPASQTPATTPHTPQGTQPATQPPVQGPPHPGWSAPPEEWSKEMPLLAPLAPSEADEHPVEWRGATFLDAQATFDDGRDHSLARAGVDLEARDLFTPGGVLEIDVEAFARSAELSSGEDDEESRARIDRLSYLWGGDRERVIVDAPNMDAAIDKARSGRAESVWASSAQAFSDAEMMNRMETTEEWLAGRVW